MGTKLSGRRQDLLRIYEIGMHDHDGARKKTFFYCWWSHNKVNMRFVWYGSQRASFPEYPEKRWSFGPKSFFSPLSTLANFELAGFRRISASAGWIPRRTSTSAPPTPPPGPPCRTARRASGQEALQEDVTTWQLSRRHHFNVGHRQLYRKSQLVGCI